MKFEDQKFWYYEQELWHGYDLDGLLRALNVETGRLPTTGLMDLAENLNILDEWYTNFPRVTFKELKTTCADIDPLDFEPLDGDLEFDRLIKLHAVVKQDSPEWKLSAVGEELKQDLKVAIGLLQLHKANYWPRTGDRLLYKGRLYDVITVTSEPEDYFQNSTVPLHITLNCELTQFWGSNIPDRVLDTRTKGKEPAWYADIITQLRPADDDLPVKGGPHLEFGTLTTVDTGDIVTILSNSGTLPEGVEPTEDGTYTFSFTETSILPTETSSETFAVPEGVWYYKLFVMAKATDGQMLGIEVQGVAEVDASGSTASDSATVDVVGTHESIDPPTVSIAFNNTDVTVMLTNEHTLNLDFNVSLVLTGMSNS